MNKTKTFMRRSADWAFRAQEQMKIDYPIGRQVSWMIGLREYDGKIVLHGERMRVLVKPIGCREQWVYVSKLLQ